LSHTCGTVVTLPAPLHLGPDTGEAQTAPNTWAKSLAHVPAPGGTKFAIVHFMNVTLPGANRLEVDLGYGTDTFTAADGGQFWTRPINVDAVGGGTHLTMRYITGGGGAGGGAFVDRYGRGESLPSHAAGHDSITNCDPFLPSGWTEPVFPHGPGTTVPKYDPFWICDKASPPAWENVRCAGPGDVQHQVAPSVGMIVTIHGPTPAHPQESISTCSVTLIDADLVLLAAHCISDHPFELPTSSVTFDYEVACDGSVLPAYGAGFYKVIKLVKYRYNDGRDYAIVQLRGSPPLPAVPVRNTMPAGGEAVFGIHHPNGAVKKASPSASGSVGVISSGSMINVNLDVAGGSSGSGLFDLAGRVMGVAAHGGGCSLNYSATAVMLDDPIEVPDPPTERAVMLVIDRSGSMGESAGGGSDKITEARDAAELFASMLRVSTGNEAGLVSFASNATSPVDSPLVAVTAASRQQLIDTLPGIAPGGRTSIGDGLAAARDELSGPGPPRAVLVLSDGMENEPQSIEDVAGLGAIEITAIGFGTESNLDGPRLTELAQTHGGFYKRAGTGLELRKFFALAFGEIFEAGALADPEYRLPAKQRQGPAVPFSVCGEETVTVILGWDTPDAALLVEVRTPSGQVVDLGSGGVETDTGRTWRFARIPLPQEGERDGIWTVRALRARGGSEFPPPDVAVNYFITINATGGPVLRPLTESRRLYTGDVLHPQVLLQFPDETVPRGGQVRLRLRRPSASVGTVLAEHGLGAPRVVAGDVIPARQATLSALEAATGTPVTGYVDEEHVLADDGPGAGTFMPSGRFGKRLEASLVVDGTYTFHARAQVGLGCDVTREVQWSYHVSVGIDPESTTVEAEPVPPGDPGSGQVRVTFTPRDRYGNHLGPGAGGDLTVGALPGCSLVGTLSDLGDGRYRQVVECDPASAEQPGITVGQPGRGPVALTPTRPQRTRYRYATTLVCGSADDGCECGSLVPGRYATAVTMLNPGPQEVAVDLEVVPTALVGATAGRWPDTAARRGHDRIALPAGHASTVDCCTVEALLLGAAPVPPRPLTHGLVVLTSARPLEVSAVYTAVAGGASPSLDVEKIAPTAVVVADRRPAPPGQVSPPPSLPLRTAPPPRPQDTPRPDAAKPSGDSR